MSSEAVHISNVTVNSVVTCAAVSVCAEGITAYQFTEHYITNANTVPVLILFLLYDFRGTWQPDKHGLCGRRIRSCAACGWLVTYLLSPPTPNTGGIKHATHTHCRPGVLTEATFFRFVTDLNIRHDSETQGSYKTREYKHSQSRLCKQV